MKKEKGAATKIVDRASTKKKTELTEQMGYLQ